MHDVIRVILIVCAVLILNGCFQLIKVAAKASDKPTTKGSGKRPKDQPGSTKPAAPVTVLTGIIAEAEAPKPAPKKRGRPKKVAPQTL